MTVKKFMELGVLLRMSDADKTVDKVSETRQNIINRIMPPIF